MRTLRARVLLTLPRPATDLLHAKFPAIDRAVVDIRARLIAEYVTATLDFIQRTDASAQERILEEIVALTASYLRSFDDAPEGPPPAPRS